MPYCPICNLHGVNEDHAIRFHSNFSNSTSTSANDIIFEKNRNPKSVHIKDLITTNSDGSITLKSKL